VLQQVDLDDDGFVWKVAMCVLQSMSATREKWQEFLVEDQLEERMETLHQYGLARMLDISSLSGSDKSSLAYILDRCIGVAHHDWGYALHPFYQTGFFISSNVRQQKIEHNSDVCQINADTPYMQFECLVLNVFCSVLLLVDFYIFVE
jgi:hypothetical protein